MKSINLNTKRLCFRIFIGVFIGVALSGSYYFGYIRGSGYSYRLYDTEVNFIKWSDFDKEKARRFLTSILDASEIPDGDMVVPGGRYEISKWQRTSTGATVIVLGKDNKGDLYVAVGNQRGLLRHPQGYMELPLPKEDLTGLRAQGASRINAVTKKPVPHDNSMEDCAAREVYEEIGIKVNKDQLKLLSVTSGVNQNPVCIAVNYYVVLNDLPILSTKDHEFANDDLSNPQWIRIKDITKRDGKCYAKDNTTSLEQNTIHQLKKALSINGQKELLKLF
jgi:ADP-ribose pyrophosphatase YjhB (NUDIX family)